MLVPVERRGSVLGTRQTTNVGNGGTGPNGATIASIVVIILLAIAVIILVLFRNNRKRATNTKYLPGDTLLSKVKRWGKLGNSSSRGRYGAELQPNPSAPSLIGRDGRRSRDTSQEPARDRQRSDDMERGPIETQEVQNESTTITTGGGIDRNTSVRSVMTLPAYTPSARETERIIGREGERGGIDTVIEFPETADEEEARREGEMESLYQIRRQRRLEQAEREERRRLRREARERGDHETLRRLQQESRARAEGTLQLTSAALIAEHQATIASRERRVSSVQYADLGVARHDGSRIRANSTDSDNRPLLDSAASISGMSFGNPSLHSRGISASSVLSVSTANGSENGDGAAHVDSDGFEVVSLAPTRSADLSVYRAPEEADVTTLGIQIPSDLPPSYDDPPDYTSPIQTRASVRSNGPPRLPSLTTVPSIEVTSVVSPMTPTPTIAELPANERFPAAASQRVSESR
ncbi:uncharacterized protein PV09_07208 [Verruconis gallopava]|uniref:Uncharacterized protein n=1 Tax=Verruconis gallopava TaxID=253628 RepID=A0A0D2A4Q7_9PEZI|nr:uncharacterized protein PV09_07208 [Verruconis gallopava]KIW01450.1 hypothetical protein PV09_07208 [Verruconis gallopava]